MSEPAPGAPAGVLDRLIGDPATFLARDLGVRPVHRPGADPAGFADLLGLDDVDAMVTGSGLRAPAFRLVRHGRTLPASDVTRRVRIGSRPVDDLVDAAAVHREVAAGATVVLQGLHRSWPPIAALCRELEEALTHPVQANAYLTPPVAQGLDLHADAHDVLVLQAHGAKRWVVHVEDGHTARPRTWDLTLGAGDVLYLPAGTRHAAQTTDQPSLHLTIGIRTIRWRDLVERALRHLLDETGIGPPAYVDLDPPLDVDLDTPLPAGWAHDPVASRSALAARLRALSVALTDSTLAVGALEDAADAFWAQRPPDLTGGLRDLLEQDTVADDTVLAVRPGLRCRLQHQGDELVMVLHDRRLRMPGQLEPAIRAILGRRTLAPQDLDALLDPASRIVVCRRLLREGVLTLPRMPDRRG